MVKTRRWTPAAPPLAPLTDPPAPAPCPFTQHASSRRWRDPFPGAPGRAAPGAGAQQFRGIRVGRGRVAGGGCRCRAGAHRRRHQLLPDEMLLVLRSVPHRGCDRVEAGSEAGKLSRLGQPSTGGPCRALFLLCQPGMVCGARAILEPLVGFHSAGAHVLDDFPLQGAPSVVKVLERLSRVVFPDPLQHTHRQTACETRRFSRVYHFPRLVSIDEGVEDLIEIAVAKGKKQNKKIKLGICGEHGGDPRSIEFCSKNGLNYVSCSPFRVPIARLAAAQAELRR